MSILVSCHHVSSLFGGIFISGFARSLYKCAALLRAVQGPCATERPLGTIHEEKASGFLFRRDMT